MHRVLLVRHGESEHHVRGMTGGWTDLPLTKRGKEQATRTAERLRELVAVGGAAVFASDLLRALMTAEPICRLLGVELHPVPELREFNNGVAAGLSLSAAKAIEIPPAGDPVDWQPYPGAETWRVMTARITSAMERLVPRVPEVAIVVTHGNSGIAVVRWWLGLADPDKHRISFDLDCCSITDLYENEWGERTIRRLNDVSHLQAGS
jgi:probable phosphoglycerate mutase